MTRLKQAYVLHSDHIFQRLADMGVGLVFTLDKKWADRNQPTGVQRRTR